jgi:hypothetical protein
MTFVYNATNDVESFAEFQDLLDKDKRLFDANEGLSESFVYPQLIRATERIITKISNTSYWKEITNNAQFDSGYIFGRYNDFSDVCIFLALSEYILPSIADFGNPDIAEVQKMQYYGSKFEALFEELVNNIDWYDFNNDGNISLDEKKSGSILPRRVR